MEHIVELNSEAGHHAVVMAKEEASIGIRTALIGMIAGVLVAVFLGFYLTLGH